MSNTFATNNSEQSAFSFRTPEQAHYEYFIKPRLNDQYLGIDYNLPQQNFINSGKTEIPGGGQEDDENRQSFGDFFKSPKTVQFATSALNFANSSLFEPAETSAAYKTVMTPLKRTLLGSAVDLANNAFGSTVDKWDYNSVAASRMGALYGGTYDQMQKYSDATGKKYGFFTGGAGRAKRGKKEGQALDMKMMSQNNKSLDYEALAQMPYVPLQRSVDMQGSSLGYLSAKKGGILEKAYKRLQSIRNKSNIIESYEDDNFICEYIPEEIDKFQKGGSFNIIPEGALHARKHNMDIEGITKKGIPVVTEKEGGEVEQQAEIEHSEIIFRLSVTEQIEEAQKKYEETKDDKYAIEIGKLLVEEILHNTDDRTNLISQI